MLAPQWPQYLCRWLCLLTLVFAQATSLATNEYRARRVGTSETGGGAGVAEKHTAVVFAGGLSLAEYESATAQAAVATPQVTTVHYTRGPDMGGGVGGLLYTNRAATGGGGGAGAIKYNLSNGRGDIVAQSDAAGALTWTASYEAYGKRTKETGTNADKQRANTKDEDPTGLLNEGHRYRDLETGAFISRDPAGFVDGPNLYAYVRQNPWTAFDPKGLEKVVVSGQPGDHNGRRHFLVNGLDRAQKMKDQVQRDKSSEKVTWLVYNDGKKGGYAKKDIEEYRDKATKAGVDMKIVSSAKDIVSYVNDKSGKDDPRSGDKISSFAYLGHASPGKLLVGFIDHGTWNMLTCDNFSPNNFRSSAFGSGCDVNLVGGCRTGVSGFWGNCALEFAAKVDSKSTVKSSSVRVNYGREAVDTDQDLVAPGKNKGPNDEHGCVLEHKGCVDKIPSDMPVGYF